MQLVSSFSGEKTISVFWPQQRPGNTRSFVDIPRKKTDIFTQLLRFIVASAYCATWTFFRKYNSNTRKRVRTGDQSAGGDGDKAAPSALAVSDSRNRE